MNNDVKVLLDAAELLTRMAKEKQGVSTSDPRLEEILAVWDKLKEQYRKEDEARVDVAKCYETHKFFWKAAEREGWPSNIVLPDGTRGKFWSANYKTANEFRDAVAFLYTTTQGQAWLSHPLNKDQVPKGYPEA
jgi:hypothetical protein